MPENTYEITYVVNSVLGDDQIRNLVGRVTKFIEKEGGNIIEVDEWGAQRLAYPIDKKRTGYYVNAYFEAGGELIARLERALTLEDDILRFLTLKMDAVMLRHYEERKEQRAREKAEGVKESAADKEEAKAEAPAEETKAEAPAEETKAEAPAEETKAEAPAEEAKAEAPAEEKKAEAPVEEAKAEAPAEEKKAEAPAEEAKAEAPAEEAKAEAPAEEKKAEALAEEKKAEAPAEEKKETEAETSAEETKADDQA